MEKNAFVTGATGFLGINLVQNLLQQGWKVTVLHRPQSNLTYLNQFDLTKVVGRIEDYTTLETAMPDNIDVVFHVAANTGAWSKLDKQQYQDNVVGTRNVVKCSMFLDFEEEFAVGLRRGGLRRVRLDQGEQRGVAVVVVVRPLLGHVDHLPGTCHGQREQRAQCQMKVPRSDAIDFHLPTGQFDTVRRSRPYLIDRA